VGLDAPAVEKTAMNVPNLLSISRVVAVPAFIILLNDPTPARALAAGVLFALASATDWLDGYLARRWGQVTRIGKLLDPVADKVFIASALIMLVAVDPERTPPWIVIVIIGREIAVTGLRAMAADGGMIIPAETAGKYKVGAQITAIIALLGSHVWQAAWLIDVGQYALWAALALAVYSGGQYFMNYWKNLE
jgi:CDP-diacylglycerol---glycerol-3-phosphate 3-phosphatidyltransferase